MHTLVLFASVVGLVPNLGTEGASDEPWMAVVRHADHFAVETPQHAGGEVVFAVRGLDGLAPGVVRSDWQGATLLAPGHAHTISDGEAMWRLVPFSRGQRRNFWDGDHYGLALIRTDMVSGEETGQMLDVSAEDGPAILRWAGDLNGDGKLDFLVDDGDATLWMSGGGTLVEPHRDQVAVDVDLVPSST